MNVTLPNGTVVTDVPDDITQVELARIAVNNNLATVEDFGDLLSDDDTTTLGALGEFGKRALGGIGTGSARVVSGLGQLLPGVDDQSMIDMEMGVRRSISDTLDYDPAYDENYIAQLGEVAGEMVPQVASFFLPGGIPARATQLATMIGPAVSEGGMDRATEEQERGEALTDYERLASKGADVVLGRLEQFGLPSRILKGLPKGFFQTAEGNPILRRIESMVMSGLSEGTQEAAQGILRDITTKAIYDPDRAIADSVVEDFQLGGGAGALFDFIISSVTGGNRRTPKVDAPEEIRPPTEDEIEAEQQARAKEATKEDRRRRAMDRALSAQAPTTPPDPRDTTGIDPELSADEITGQIVDIAGAYRGRTTIPKGSLFEVQEQEGKFYVTHEGEQFGPAMRDPIKAQEVKAALSEVSDNLNVERTIAESGIDYTPQESAKVMRFYQQIRNAGRRYTPEDPAEPTIPRQPEPPARVNLLTNRINTALNRKGIDTPINSAEGAAVVQTIIGRPVSESTPLADLSAVEQDYVLQTIIEADPLTPQARATTETREQVDPVTGLVVPSQPRVTGPRATLSLPNFAAIAKPVEPTVPSEPVEAGKEIVPFEPEQETLQDRAIESTIAKQLQGILKSVGLADDFVVKTVDQVGRARRDSAGNVYISPIKKKSGDQENYVTFGSAQLAAKVIQISTDGIKYRVDQGMSFEEATAAVMNHEILHALRGMDLFTAQEYSLLERLTRQYSKPGTDMTYGQWAVKTYPELSAVAQQEEAIAEMISDSLTNNVLIDGKAQALSGKPAGIIRRIVDLFKRLVGFARDNDINSYQELVNAIQTGQVGARERGQVRTLMKTEKERGQVEERSLTTEDLQLRTGTRPTKEQLDAVYNNLVQQVKQQVGDAPEVVADSELEEVIEARGLRFPKKAQTIPRLARAIEQGFNVDTVYYHGTSVPDIRRFDGSVGMGVVAGHFTTRPRFANQFAPAITIPDLGQIPTVYPVFLRYGRENEFGGIAEIRSLIQDEDNPVRRSLSTPLSRQPRLKADLEAFFAAELEKGRLYGPDQTKLKSFEQQDLARFYYEGARPVEAVAEDLAEDFHNDAAQGAYAEITEGPYDVDFAQLEVIAPYMKEAGFKGYYDIEEAGKSYSGIAMFNSEDIKGVFAEFDPESVPEGRRYEDDIMYSRSAVDMFEEKAFDHIGAPGRETLIPGRINPAHKARHTIVDMPIDMFLGLAQVGHQDGKEKGVEDLIKRGVKFSELPQLHTKPVDSEEYGPVLLVGGHEGRHRARALKAAGYTTMPVRIFDQTIRWGEQDNPKSFDYLKYWPEMVISEADINRKTDPSKAGYQPVGLYTYPMFINRDGTVNFGSPIDRPSVIFEVAPDPRNEELSNRWNSLSDEARLEISERVARAVVPSALAEVSASGEIVSQIGSYYDDTNPSFAVRLTSGDPTDAASAVGFVLQQESMMIVSPRPYEGADSQFDPRLEQETRSIPAVFIRIGDKPLAEVNKIYQRLRAVEGVPEISGQTTIDGEMMILLTVDADVDAVVDAFDSALDNQYPIGSTVLFSSFPEAKDYDYETQRPDTRIRRETARERLIDLRAEAQSEVARAIERLKGTALDARSGSANSPDYEQTVRGAITPDGRLALTHFATKELDRTDPTLAGTGADRAKRNRPRIGTWFGVVDAEVDPYIKEPMIGNVPNEFLVDPSQIYVIDDASNPSAPFDPESVWTTQPNGDPDYEAIGKKVRELGFNGYLINAPALGKVVVMHTPLSKDGSDDIMESRRSIRSIDQAKLDKAVEQNEKEARNAGFSVPLYSVKASPEAQYIARNPEAAVDPEEILESRAPEYNTKTKSFINRLIESTPERADPMRQYMDVTGDNSTVDYKLTQAKQALVNRYARLEKLNQRYFKDYLADSSSIAAVLFADRSAGVTAEAIKSGVPQYRDGLTKVVDFSYNGKQYRGLVDIINLLRTKKYGDISEFAQAYAIAMRGERLNKEGKPTPVSQQDIDEARENIKQFTDTNGYNPVIEWYGAWQAYNNQVITFLEDTGVIDEKGAESWRLASDYIPFYRALEPNYDTGKITNHPFGDLKKLGAFKPYKGKTDKINVPLVESIVKNTAAAIDLGMRNVAQQRIARDMQKLQLARQVKYGTQGPDIVTLKVRGKPVSFRIYDPLILDSMTAIDGSGIEEISRIFFGPASTLLRETVTRTPGFMLANMLRDSLSAFVTSGSSFVPLIGTTKGFFSNINNLERTGVIGGYDFKVDQQDIGKTFREEAERRKRNGMPVNMFKTLWDASGRLTTRSDAATRQAVYDEVYARTGNEAEAYFQAMEVLNFSRRGSNGVVRAITAAIPFLNARIQGLDVLWRSGLGVNTAKRGVPRGTAALSFAMRGAIISFATALYWMMVSDDDEYREASREERDNNWLFPVPWLEGVGAIAIPIPFEVGLIFKTIPEVMLDTTAGNRTSRQAFQSFKQGLGSTLELNLLYGIQAYAPLLEAHSNYNSYTGRPIVPIWLTGQRPEYQRTESTSETAIFLQKATPYLAAIPMLGMDEGGTSPMKIEHVIKGYTGSMGGFILSWTDRVLRSKSGREAMANAGYDVSQPEMPSLALYDYPVVKRFLTAPEGSGLKEQFYDLSNEVRQDYNTINQILERGDQDEFNSLYPKIEGLLEVRNDVEYIRKVLSDIRQDKKAIMRAEMSAEQRRYMLDQLKAYENEMLKVVPLLEARADRSAIRGL